MEKSKKTQIQILETWRGELDMSVPDFAPAIGVSRQWYYGRLKSGLDVINLKDLSQMAVDYAGDWQSEMAVACIKLIDPRFVPCVCQTEFGDNGVCPKCGDVKKFKEFLEGCSIEDLSKTVKLFSPVQKSILQQFIQQRSDKQFKAMKAGVAA